MTRICTVCRSTNRDEIDKLLASDTATSREIAQRYSIGKDALYRHCHRHLKQKDKPPEQSQAPAPPRAAENANATQNTKLAELASYYGWDSRS